MPTSGQIKTRIEDYIDIDADVTDADIYEAMDRVRRQAETLFDIPQQIDRTDATNITSTGVTWTSMDISSTATDIKKVLVPHFVNTDGTTFPMHLMSHMHQVFVEREIHDGRVVRDGADWRIPPDLSLIHI